MINMMLLLGLIAALGLIAITMAWYKNQYFKMRCIDYIQPLPFFGNMLKIMVGKNHIIDLTRKTIHDFPQNKYVGVFNFFSPTVLITDIDLVKQIFIKDFDHFVDHIPFTDEHVDPIFAKNLFSLTGDRWREMRNTLSPAFTSSKMRGMFPFIIECSDNFTDYLKTEIESSGKEVKEFNSKHLTARFANDVIATCAFGVKINSFTEQDNSFFKFAKGFTEFSTIAMLKIFLFLFSPSLVRFLKLKLSNESSILFFRNLMLNKMASREKNNIVRQDMIHLLMLAKKGSLKSDSTNPIKNEEFAAVKKELTDGNTKKTKWTDDDLLAQALVFIFAGFDTVSTVLGFLLHELAVNPDIQDKLFNEIETYFNAKTDEFEYNDLFNLKYLDMVVSETLRLWPTVPVVNRICVKPYNLPAQNELSGTKHKLNVGDNVWIPAYDFQRNPKYYPNPEKFDPERFSEENRSIIDTNSYMPFGIGPRACIGSRFALMELKMITVQLLRQFKIVPTPNTPNPLKLKSSLFNMEPEGEFFIGIQKRN